MEEVPVSYLLSIFSGIKLHIFSAGFFWSTLIIFTLLVCSALISASEVAYFSLSSYDLEGIENKNVRKLLKKPNQLLATILIANNFINVGIVVMSVFVSSIAISFPENSVLQFIFQIIIITSLLLLFGEIMPKLYAKNNPLAFSRSMSRILLFLKNILFPFAYFLVKSTNIIERRLAEKKIEISVEEISKVLDENEHENKENERRILRSIVEFGNTDVKEIMKSRVDILAINKSDSFSQVLKVIVSSGYSRIPVYEKQIDKIVGILYVKDLIPHLNEIDKFNWQKLCRAAYFVPETKMINDLLKDFQTKKNHLAIVVDEYGGTSGLVTLEDVLEEIVGEINDEFDVDNNIYSKLDKYTYIFDGKISLNDFLKIVKLDIDFFDKIKGESDTLAGLVLEIIGKIPKIGTVCNVPPFTIVVESADLRKIKRLKVTIDD